MEQITGKQPISDILYVLENLYEERDSLTPAETFLAGHLHFHLFHDGKAVTNFIGDNALEYGHNLRLASALTCNSVKELELMFSKRLVDNSAWDHHEASLWLKVWLFLYSRPPFALKVIESSLPDGPRRTTEGPFTTEEQLLVYFLTGNVKAYDTLIKQGGVTESRLRHSILSGDLKGDYNGAVKLLSKNDAVETVLKMEYVYRGKLNEEAFWETEQNLYSSLNEVDFKEAVLFTHAAADKEEFALEQLMALAEKPNWAKALALRTAIKLAAAHGEDVMLMKLYQKMYQVAKSTELKGAVCLRAAQIADFRLHRYREAEEFYRIAVELGARPFISRRGLFRMLLNRKAYGEVIQLADDSGDQIISACAAILCEYRLSDFQKALDIVPTSDIPTRASLFMKMKEWDHLESIYSAPKAPVPPSVAKLMTSLISGWRGDYEKAASEMEPITSVSPLIATFFNTFWLKYQENHDGLFEEGEKLVKLLSSPKTKAAVRLTIATWLKDINQEQAAQLIGAYLDSGGHLPSTQSNETSWLEVLLRHPMPNPEWFEEIEQELDKLLEETEQSKEWERLASLLKIKSMVVKHDLGKIDYLMRLAKLYEEVIGNIEEATNYYTQVLNINSSHKRALDSLARINETNEDWDKYLQVIRLSMEANTDKSVKASLYFKYGSILETQFNKIDEALKYYKLAIDASPTSLPALHGIRDIYVKKEHWKGVLNTLKMEASIWDDPKEKAGIYTQMGDILHEELGKSEQAEIYFTAAMKLRPDSPGALRALFKLYYNNADWEKAAEIAGSLTKRALSVGTSEDRAQFFYERGLVFFHTGDMQEAAMSFISSIQLDKNNMAPLHSLLEISSQYHNPIEFTNFLLELEEVYEETDIKEAKSLIAIARAKLNQANNNSEQALELFSAAGENSPLLIDAVIGEANLLLLIGKEQEAYDRWQHYYTLARNDKEQSTNLLQMAKFYSEKLDRPREAMTILRGILQKDPNNHKCLYELASELFASGQSKEAMVTIDQLLTLTKSFEFKDKTDYVVLATLVKFTAGEVRKAETLLNAIDISQLNVTQGIVIAYILTKKKEFSKALNVLKKARVENAADKNQATLHRGLLAYIAGNANGAIEELSAISEQYPEALPIIADISIAHETRQQSVKWLQKMIPHHYDDIGFLEMLEERVPDLDNHKRRIFQVRSLFDPDVVLAPQPVPLLRNGAMVSEEYKSAIGVKDPTGPASQMWLAIKKGLEAIFPPTDPALPEARAAKGPELLAWEEVEATLGQSGVLWVADLQTKPVLVIPHDTKPQVVVKPSLFDLPITSIRFVLGRALEAARSGYSLLFHLSWEQRKEVFSVMYSLALPPQERDETAKKFLASLERRSQKAVERVSASAWEIFPALDLDEWLDGVELALDKTGLLLSGDPLGAIMGSNYLHNRYIDATADPIANFAMAPRSDKLISHYISFEWNSFYHMEDQGAMPI